MDFKHLPRGDRRVMAEIEDRLRGPSGKMPSSNAMVRRLDHLKSITPDTDRMNRQNSLLFGLTLLPFWIGLYYLSENWGTIALKWIWAFILFVYSIPLIYFGIREVIQDNKVQSSKHQELEIMLLKHALDLRSK